MRTAWVLLVGDMAVILVRGESSGQSDSYRNNFKRAEAVAGVPSMLPLNLNKAGSRMWVQGVSAQGAVRPVPCCSSERGRILCGLSSWTPPGSLSQPLCPWGLKVRGKGEGNTLLVRSQLSTLYTFFPSILTSPCKVGLSIPIYRHEG